MALRALSVWVLVLGVYTPATFMFAAHQVVAKTTRRANATFGSDLAFGDVLERAFKDPGIAARFLLILGVGLAVAAGIFMLGRGVRRGRRWAWNWAHVLFVWQMLPPTVVNIAFGGVALWALRRSDSRVYFAEAMDLAGDARASNLTSPWIKVLAGLACVACLLPLLLSLSPWSNFRPANARAMTRSCYATQKTIVVAVEMYCLDKNTKVTLFDERFFRELVSGGYLREIPEDPGEGSGTREHFQVKFGRDGVGIRCTTHGMIQ